MHELIKMEVNGNSTDVPSDAINIIVEFAQSSSEGDKENGDILNSSDDVAVHVFQISSELLNSSQSQVSVMRDAEATSSRSQRASHIDVIKRLKSHQNKQETLQESKSKSCPPAGHIPSFISPQLPVVARELQFHNDEVVNCQTQVNKTNRKRKITNAAPVESLVQGSTVEMRPGQITSSTKRKITSATPVESSVQGSTVEMRPGQITTSTKLALQTFLKKKAAGIANGVSVEGNKNTTEPEVQVTSPDEEAGACDDLLHSNQAANKDKDLTEVSPPLESVNENGMAMTGVSESLTTNSLESAQESQKKKKKKRKKEMTSTTVQSKNFITPSTQRSDIEQPSGETGVPVNQVVSTPVVQEVDVVVLPLNLESDNSEQGIKPQKKKKKKKTDPKQPKQEKYLSYDCVECGKHFPNKTAYSAHMNIHYDRRPYKCVECGKTFRQSSHLEKHKLLHTGETPYVCQYCNRAFRCRYNHRDHERIHTGEKPCKCKTCGKMFRCSSKLSSHRMSIHGIGSSRYTKNARSGKGAFSCKICKKTFSWSSALSTHKKTHNAVGTYKCSKCPKVFKCNSNLWNHVKTHSKEKPFECELCGQHLKRKGNLKRHLLTQHDPDEAEEYLKTSKMFAASMDKKSK